jgi:hypothetical protein
LHTGCPRQRPTADALFSYETRTVSKVRPTVRYRR